MLLECGNTFSILWICNQPVERDLNQRATNNRKCIGHVMAGYWRDTEGQSITARSEEGYTQWCNKDKARPNTSTLLDFQVDSGTYLHSYLICYLHVRVININEIMQIERVCVCACVRACVRACVCVCEELAELAIIKGCCNLLLPSISHLDIVTWIGVLYCFIMTFDVTHPFRV